MSATDAPPARPARPGLVAGPRPGARVLHLGPPRGARVPRRQRLLDRHPPRRRARRRAAQRRVLVAGLLPGQHHHRRVEHDRPGRPGAPGAAAAREPPLHPAGGAARTRRSSQSRIDELLDAVADAGELEVVHDLAAQLPSRLTADLLGFPEDRWEDIKSWSERLMRTDAMLRDPEAAMGMMSAIMEFNPLLEEIAAERKGCPTDDLISVWAEAGYDPMSMMHETGLFIAGGAETTRTVIAPRPGRARRAPRPVGGGGRRPVARRRPGRGGHPLGHAAQQHVPAGHPRRPHRRPAGGRGRPGDARLPERQPRRGRVRRPVHLRHPARPEPAPRLRAGHPLLRRRQPGPPRAAPAVRRPDPAVDATCGSSPRPTSSRTSSPARSAASTWPSTSADGVRAGRPRGRRRAVGLPPARRRLGLVERRAGHRRRRVAARRHAVRPGAHPADARRAPGRVAGRRDRSAPW